MGHLCESGRFSYVNHSGPLPLRELHSTDETIVRRDPGGSWACLRPVPTTCEFCPEFVADTDIYICMWCLSEAGRFSYGESPRTPPLEGTSLHRRNNSVERPWGILSLFTTCSHHVWILSRVCSWHRHIYVCGVLVKQVVFLTVNHRGPLPLRELHSTDETIVWRDLGGSWACLRPVPTSCEFCPESVAYTDIYMYVVSFWSRPFFLRWITADPSPWRNFTPPTKQWCGETLGDLSLFTIRSEFTLPEAVPHTCMVCVEQATWRSLPFLPSICVGSSGSGRGEGGGEGGYRTISDYQCLSHKHMEYKWVK